MFPQSRSARVSSVLAGVLLAVPAWLGAAQSSPFNQPLSGEDAAAVEQARSGAMRKLRDPECLKVLTDFRDGDGRTLAENLEPWGMSAADYLQRLPFRHGGSLPICRREAVALVATEGSLPVYLCPAAGGHPRSLFAAVQAGNSSLAEAMVIHEMLHSLGLGENPPTQSEITARVRARCR